MAFVHHDDVVEALAADGANQSLDVRVLPGATRRGEDLLHPQSTNSPLKVFTVDVIAVAEKIACRVDIGESLDNLLPGPLCRGIGGDMEVQDPAPIVREDEEDEEHLELDRRYDEEVS